MSVVEHVGFYLMASQEAKEFAKLMHDMRKTEDAEIHRRNRIH